MVEESTCCGRSVKGDMTERGGIDIGERPGVAHVAVGTR